MNWETSLAKLVLQWAGAVDSYQSKRICGKFEQKRVRGQTSQGHSRQAGEESFMFLNTNHALLQKDIGCPPKD